METMAAAFTHLPDSVSYAAQRKKTASSIQDAAAKATSDAIALLPLSIPTCNIIQVSGKKKKTVPKITLLVPEKDPLHAGSEPVSYDVDIDGDEEEKALDNEREPEPGRHSYHRNFLGWVLRLSERVPANVTMPYAMNDFFWPMPEKN